MPNFQNFWNRQHISVNDLNALISDIEESRRSLIKDLNINYSSKVLTTNYGTSSCKTIQDTTSPSLTVYVMGGVAFSANYNRVLTEQGVLGETQISTTNTQINADYPISGVESVYVGSIGMGLNYYTGGSFDPINAIITTGTILPSANCNVYINYSRMPSYTTTDSPTGANSLIVKRIDLLYLEYKKVKTSPLSIDFIDENRNLYQEVVYTRSEDSFELKRVMGVESLFPAHPTLPGGDVIPLAYIHLRNNTSAIYDSDQSTIATGFIEDARQTI